MLCQGCRMSLIDSNKRVYYYSASKEDLENGDALYWCKTCNEKTEFEHPREKLKHNPGLEEKDNSKYLDSMLQEYYDLDCEDVIGGGTVKTKFQYTSVPAEDYGLTPEEILLLDDNKLNKFAPLKKIRPYRDDEEKGNKNQKKVNDYKLQ